MSEERQQNAEVKGRGVGVGGDVNAAGGTFIGGDVGMVVERATNAVINVEQVLLKHVEQLAVNTTRLEALSEDMKALAEEVHKDGIVELRHEVKRLNSRGTTQFALTLAVIAVALLLALTRCAPTPTALPPTATPVPWPTPAARVYCTGTTTNDIGLWKTLHYLRVAGRLRAGVKFAAYLDLDGTRYYEATQTLVAWVAGWQGGATGWYPVNYGNLKWDDEACVTGALDALGVPWPLPELAPEMSPLRFAEAAGGEDCALVRHVDGEWFIEPAPCDVVSATPTPTATGTPTPTASSTATPTHTLPFTATPTPTDDYITVDPTWHVTTTANLHQRECASTTCAKIDPYPLPAGVRLTVYRPLVYSCEDDNHHHPYIWAWTETDAGVQSWMAMGYLNADCGVAQWWIDPPIDPVLWMWPTQEADWTPPFVAYTPTPTVTATPLPTAGPLPVSPYGVHGIVGPRIGFGDGLDQLAHAGRYLSVALAVDDCGMLVEVEQYDQRTITIFRTRWPGDTPASNFTGPPDVVARVWMEANMPIWARCEADYYVLLNEPDPDTKEKRIWLNAFTEYCQDIAGDEYRLVLYNWATGVPELGALTNSAINEMDDYWPSLAKGAARGDLLGLHEYGLDALADDIPYLAGRHRLVWRDLQARGIDIAMVITEVANCGGREVACEGFAWEIEQLQRYDCLVRESIRGGIRVTGYAHYTLGGVPGSEWDPANVQWVFPHMISWMRTSTEEDCAEYLGYGGLS